MKTKATNVEESFLRDGAYPAETKFHPNMDIDGSDHTNGDRADRGFAAVMAYIEHTGDQPDECHFRDLLNDLMHLADREGIDFDESMRVARSSYEQEAGL
jgi:hypothetical protein